jgi:hypothetical protein
LGHERFGHESAPDAYRAQAVPPVVVHVTGHEQDRGPEMTDGLTTSATPSLSRPGMTTSVLALALIDQLPSHRRIELGAHLDVCADETLQHGLQLSDGLAQIDQLRLHRPPAGSSTAAVR